MTKLGGDSYKTYSSAVAKLGRFSGAIGSATNFVIAQVNDADGTMRYYPVVVYRDGTNCNVGPLVHNGISVVN